MLKVDDLERLMVDKLETWWVSCLDLPKVNKLEMR